MVSACAHAAAIDFANSRGHNILQPQPHGWKFIHCACPQRKWKHCQDTRPPQSFFSPDALKIPYLDVI